MLQTHCTIFGFEPYMKSNSGHRMNSVTSQKPFYHVSQESLGSPSPLVDFTNPTPFIHHHTWDYKPHSVLHQHDYYYLQETNKDGKKTHNLSNQRIKLNTFNQQHSACIFLIFHHIDVHKCSSIANLVSRRNSPIYFLTNSGA